jgi:ADP-ribose pyrophosphatase YjhB (NUDIX family)
VSAEIGIGAGGIVINNYGEVLLIRRDDTRTWAPPGGALDPGELPNEGVAREVREETGVIVEPVRLVGLYFSLLRNQDFLSFIFRCIQRGGEPAPSEESPEVGFYALNPPPGRMLELHASRIRQALHHAGGPPVLVRQQNSLKLRIGWQYLTLYYRYKDLKRWLQGQPPHIPAPIWTMGVFALITNQQGQVLWARRRDNGMWNLPGGGREKKEAPWEALVREVREETGLEARPLDVQGVYVKPLRQEMVINFTATIEGGNLTTGPESVEFAYFTPGEEPENTLARQVERVADWARNPGIGLPTFRHQ